MEELSIKLQIADRTYPLKVKASEEESVRKAARMINERIRDLLANYAVQDKQDVLAMYCLEVTSQVVNEESKKGGMGEEVLQKISGMNQRLKKVLGKS